MSVTEHPGNTARPGWSKEAIRERIVSDFRDLPFHLARFLQMDRHTILGRADRRAVRALFPGLEPDARPDRALAVPPHRPGGAHRRQPGGQAVHAGSPASMRAASMSATPPGWARRRPRKVRDFRIEVRLVPLIWGNLVVPLVKIDQPDVLVVRDASGRTNWDNGVGQPGLEAAAHPAFPDPGRPCAHRRCGEEAAFHRHGEFAGESRQQGRPPSP